MKFKYESMNQKLRNFGVDPATVIEDMSAVKTLHRLEQEYYTVRFSRFSDSVDGLEKIRDWCQENFGDDWIYSYSTFVFKNQGDATLASLKWG